MKEISVSELQDNMFDAIGKEWMLVTAGTQEKFNMMTASWGRNRYFMGENQLLSSLFVRNVIHTNLLKKEIS